MMLLIVLLFAIIGTAAATNIECESNEVCESTLREGSKCVNGFCDNPFQYGCLRSLGIRGFENTLRACNSNDPEDAPSRGVCRPSGELTGLEYEEIRIFSQDWDSPLFEAWILQILLSEYLDVPASIETGEFGKNFNFYDQTSRFGYGVPFDWGGIERASTFKGDCSKAERSDEMSYQSCGHIILELWTGYSNATNNLIEKNQVEALYSLGITGEENWFIPNFTATTDVSLTSYHGLQGFENRRKLAERFLRPTRWADYCNEVSEDGCASGDDVAKRPPKNEEEEKKFFSENLYIGHFRRTKDNDCDASPGTCTGHFIDYPCGWKRLFLQQSHYLGIGLKSNGPEGESGGYPYNEMVEIWNAANWTKSDVIGFWWRPEALYQKFQGTDMEFQKVNLPNPNSECVTNRLQPEAMCGGEDNFGSPKGTCDIPPVSLRKIVSTGLQNLVASEKSEAKRSPAYKVLTRFTMDNYELEDIFTRWSSDQSADKDGYNTREAVCHWVGQHFKTLKDRLLLPTYPRQLEEIKNTKGTIGALAFGSIVASTTTIAGTFTYCYRKDKVFQYAQVEFVFLLLFGLLLVSISAITTALPPSNISCMASVWLKYIGYTFEIGPLVVKIAAINKLLQEAQKMRRVQLSKKLLYAAVAALVGGAVIFMILWTVLDPPENVGVFLLTNRKATNGRTIITVAQSCQCKHRVWYIVAAGIQTVFLLGGSILAFMTRKMKNDINETSTVAFLVYSNFVCVLLRLILYLLENLIDATVRNVLLSLILSVDVFAAILIYFVPKFVKIERRSHHMSGLISSMFKRSKSTNRSTREESRELSCEQQQGAIRRENCIEQIQTP